MPKCTTPNLVYIFLVLTGIFNDFDVTLAWHLTTAKNGMSAKTLERTLGISYRTAWTMLQRFRVAMVAKERKQLSGVVEVDETLVGGVQQGGKRGRGTTKSIVVIAVEIKQPKGFGRVRMRYVPDASGASLIPFVCDVVAPESVVLTDGWSGYNELPDYGYTRKKSCYHHPAIPPMSLCQVFIELQVCLIDGFLVPTRAQ
jgi:transposase-like protein